MNPVTPDRGKTFLGVGWAFPPILATNGAIAEAVYEEDVRQAILIILGTNPGERIMRPDFGVGLKTFVFEPINATTIARISTSVEDALVRWEPRIELIKVGVIPQKGAPSTLLIQVDYLVRATNTLFNLVYPFYLQEGTSA